MAEKILSIADSVTVGELADALNLSVTTLIGELFKNGIAATINQRIDFETASIIVEEIGVDVTLERKESKIVAHNPKERQLTDKAVSRPPIVAVMGHVDHGKTSLLDAILGQKVVEGESGGITQHISAYQTNRGDRSITLLDTPGHEAFAALRQHGAALTDVVIIVVAADDGVKPQTVEAIRFARSTNSKIIVAINKIDKAAANPQLVKTQLATEHNLNPEEWGGDTVIVEVSAKTGEGIDKLLDMVLLVSDLEELKAEVDTPAEGLVIEAHMETGRGAVVGLLVEQGVLRPSSFLVVGATYGKVRTLQDFNSKSLKEAGPSTPVIVTGFKEIPQFGDIFEVVKSEKEAKLRAGEAKQEREASAASTNVTGADLLKLMSQKHDAKDFNVVIKADVQGSLTSVIDSLSLIETGGEVALHIISRGVGNITENDIRLASDEQTIVYGFNVDLPPAVKQLAGRRRVEVRLFKIIYELLDDAKNEMEKLLPPKIEEKDLAVLKVKGVFRTQKDQVIAGGEVVSGKITPGLLVRAKRGNDTLGEAEITSLQREKIDVKEVFEGDICGFVLKTTSKIQLEIGDTLEFFSREVVQRHL